MNPSVDELEYELQNNFKTNYKLDSFLGEGSNSLIYRVITPHQKYYLVKFIPKTNSSHETILEIGFLKALSTFSTSYRYINTCHDFAVSPTYIIVIMNVFYGRDMVKICETIKTFPELEYMDMVKQIMRHSLSALAYIHKRGVAHQNLNPYNLVISCPDGKNIKYLKLVDFGHSCGYYLANNKYLNKKCNLISNRTAKLPPEFHEKEELIKKIKDIMKNNNTNNVELYMAKKDDIWVLGTIFWSLINRKQIGDNPLELNFPETNSLMDTLLHRNNYQNFIGLPELKPLHTFVIDNILVPIKKRKSANEILNKFLLLDKYGWHTV